MGERSAPAGRRQAQARLAGVWEQGGQRVVVRGRLAWLVAYLVANSEALALDARRSGRLAVHWDRGHLGAAVEHTLASVEEPA